MMGTVFIAFLFALLIGGFVAMFNVGIGVVLGIILWAIFSLIILLSE